MENEWYQSKRLRMEICSLFWINILENLTSLYSFSDLRIPAVAINLFSLSSLGRKTDFIFLYIPGHMFSWIWQLWTQVPSTSCYFFASMWTNETI